MLHTDFSNIEHNTQSPPPPHTHTHLHYAINKVYIFISMMHTLLYEWLLITYFQIDFLSLVLASFYYLCIQPTYYMMELNLKLYFSIYMTLHAK